MGIIIFNNLIVPQMVFKMFDNDTLILSVASYLAAHQFGVFDVYVELKFHIDLQIQYK